jgi:hypothetical protein
MRLNYASLHAACESHHTVSPARVTPPTVGFADDRGISEFERATDLARLARYHVYRHLGPANPFLRDRVQFWLDQGYHDPHIPYTQSNIAAP